jgi:hypothetical protein
MAMLFIVAMLIVPTIASAIVVNFDNLGPPTGLSIYILGPPPANNIVDGFKFGAVGGAANRVDVVDTNYFLWGSSHSGEYSLLNNVLGNAVVTEKDGNTFSFQSVWARTLAPAYGNTGERHIVGYLSGVVVGSITFDLSTNWQQVTGNLSNIDTLVFELTSDGRNGLYFLDDLVLNESTPVPEPSTLLLLGSGLVGLVGYGRRRMKK